MKSRSLTVVALALLALPLPAAALCTVLCSCTASTTGVAFGSYNPLSASNVDSTGNVQVTCTGVVGVTVPFQIALDKGANSTAFSPRKMASSAHRLNYDLYTDVTHATIWGDGTAGTQIVSGTFQILGTPQNSAVYGRIPGSQRSVPPGSYTDTVHVTVTYQ